MGAGDREGEGAVQKPVEAAGGLVVRFAGGEPQVLLVHRPKYDDWSYPKGKLDRGESFEQAAVREIEEETWVRARPLRELSAARYRLADGRPKVARYWQMEPLADRSGERPPDGEVDEVRWTDLEKAREMLTQPFDRALLDELEL